MKCPKCGTELEGDRCPKCDFKYDKEYDKAIETLMKLPYVGEKRAKALYQHGFADMDSIKKTPVDRLANIEGLGEGLAEKIKESILDKLQTTEKGLFVCSECGSLIPEDATNCPKCGVPLIDEVDMVEEIPEEEPDEIDISENIIGKIIEKQEAIKSETDKSDIIIDTQKKQPIEAVGIIFNDKIKICGECGAFIKPNQDICEICGAKIAESGTYIETEKDPMDVLKQMFKIDVIPDISEEVEDKKIKMCSVCGAVAVDVDVCPVCGSEILELPATEEIDKEKSLVEDFAICPVCGALVDKNSKFCPVCNSELTEVLKIPGKIEQEKDETIDATKTLEIMAGKKLLEAVPLLDEENKDIKICPSCGSFVKEKFARCPNCNVILKPELIEKKSVKTILPERKVKKVKQKIKAKETIIPTPSISEIKSKSTINKPIKIFLKNINQKKPKKKKCKNPFQWNIRNCH